MADKSIDLVCYLSNGYPTHEETLINAKAYVEGGCDVIEIDLPNDNPYIDGELLQKRMKHSYFLDESLESHIKTIYDLRSKFPHQRIIILSYEKTITKLGVKKFANIYKDNNIESLILVDRTDDKVKNQLMEHGVKIVSYLQSTMKKVEIDDAKNTNGFIYLQAKNGQEDDEEIMTKNIIRLRKKFRDKEIYCGVGISSPEDIIMVKQAKGDGVFVGSAVFTKESNKDEMKAFIKKLKESTLI